MTPPLRWLLWLGSFLTCLGPLPGQPVPRDRIPRIFLPGADARGPASREDRLAALGRRLFFDPQLSADGQVACASCHDPRHGFATPAALPSGVFGRHALRNAPTLLNRRLGRFQSWDGRARSLQEQVLLPISNPNEMGLPLKQALARIARSSFYRQAFGQLLGGEPKGEGLARALSSFVATLTLSQSPVDRFRAGDGQALTEAEREGLWIYESKGQCWRCHRGPNFSDESFHNTGVGVVAGVSRPGRLAITGSPADRGRFKTPTLRGLTFTAPYMHDGSFKSLREVVAFYRRGGGPNRWLDRRLHPLELDEQDMRHLVAFLKALSPRALGPYDRP